MMLQKKKVAQGYVVTVKEQRVDMAMSRTFRDELSTLLQEKPATVVIDLSETLNEK